MVSRSARADLTLREVEIVRTSTMTVRVGTPGGEGGDAWPAA